MFAARAAEYSGGTRQHFIGYFVRRSALWALNEHGRSFLGFGASISKNAGKSK